ncbi:MAG: phosphate ABC transporter permease PstA [Bradyrhizobium sp.]|uniref:phosphate ABC transporter permease PstA n=1 Tax=Bradyrhizobium sp. TaxID=376 RepID=UPI0025B9050C|nr:phosphate ABC transporter permease PstA [Bradyrhizobium sp.]MBI5264489.1 phosphate ABC transporter permease PstA [Bradyrhizobium sp.]
MSITSTLTDGRVAGRAADSEFVRRLKRRRTNETVFICLGLAATSIGLIALAALMIDLAASGYPRLTADFFTNFPSRRAGQAGILSAWVGSLLVISVTAFIGVPLGVAAGIYLEEYAPKNIWTNIIEINVSNLAGVPSIVFGLLALGLFVYGFGTGRSIFTAGLTLALLILPIIIVATREAIRAVPWSLREAAYGVGATKWQVTQDHVLPAAVPGVLTGVIIGISRALGETAPLVTIGALSFIAFLPPSPVSADFPFISFAWLFEGFTVLPIQAFNWVSRPGDDFQSNAAAAGLVLMAITLVLNGVAIYFRYRLRKKLQW